MKDDRAYMEDEKIGKRVKIYNSTLDGREVFEGMAVIKRATPNASIYMVHFDDDEPRTLYPRFVDFARQ